MGWFISHVEDLRYTLRQMRRAPAFVATAALTIALGIGANTAVFSIINGYLRPLPVPHPEELVVIAARMPSDDAGVRYKVSHVALQDYRAVPGVFTDLFAFDIRICGLGVAGKVEPFIHLTVSGNFFSGLGITPAAGRFLEPGEGEHANADPVIVLGYSYWMHRFGGRLDAIGSVVRLNGLTARVIGVAPEGFKGVIEGADMDGYIPLGINIFNDPEAPKWFTERSFHFMTMMGRLAPGVSVERAQAALDVVSADLGTRYPATERGVTTLVIPETMARPLPLPFLMNLLPIVKLLLAILGSIVLLIACMNVANLMLVRATVREREMAVRAALGAGRRRLMRLQINESLLIGLAGAALGLLLGKMVSVAFADSIEIGMDIPIRLDFNFDWQVFGVALAMAIGTGLVVGILPALRASRAQVTELLHDGARAGSAGVGKQRFRSALVVAQVAGSLALLVVAGLFVRSLQKAQQVQLGFEPDHVVVARLDTLHVGHDEARSVAFYDALQRRLVAVPGVESVSSSFTIPLGLIFGGAIAWPEGHPPANSADQQAIGRNSISPDYFGTMGIPMADGRAFADRDDTRSAHVAIVNETMAAHFWPGRNPIGQRIEIQNMPGAPWEVVGVARDSKYIAVFESPLPFFYLPQAQDPSYLRMIEVRSTMPSDEVKARLRQEIAALEPELPVADLRELQNAVSGNFGFMLFRIGVWQASAMGGLGLILAIVGVYGVVSYRTAQRAREIGIRMALGAVPADVRRLVLKQGAGLVAIGIVLGLSATVMLATLLSKVLVFVSATDPVTFVVVATVLSICTLAACYLPARRAMRVQPVEALRHE